MTTPYTAPSRQDSKRHRRGSDKLANIPVKVQKTERPARKPSWIRAKAHNDPKVTQVKKMMREFGLHSVCEEASCPNLGECFAHGTATFMIMGDICTRRCPFCDVANGRPEPLNPEEPLKLAQAIAQMGLSYIVITSVDRDDLRDGGASHFVACIRAIKAQRQDIKIEILVPDFRDRMDVALAVLSQTPADVFNHNLETVPRLYQKCRPGADYKGSLELLAGHKDRVPAVNTKSGLMLGLGETLEEVEHVMTDLRAHGCNMLTIGQYLQPSLDHLPVDRFVTPEEFKQLEDTGYNMGFSHVASGPMVRSSYHADQQAAGLTNNPSGNST